MQTKRAARPPMNLSSQLQGDSMTASEKSLRFTLSTVLFAMFFVLVAGTFRARAGDAPIVRANYAAFSGAFAPLWIAADKNLFAKYGLNVDLRYIAPATATQALILSLIH